MRRLPRWSIAALVAITVLGGALRFDAAGDPGRYHSRDAIAYSMIARVSAWQLSSTASTASSPCRSSHSAT